jgi:hypothetical protein
MGIASPLLPGLMEGMRERVRREGRKGGSETRRKYCISTIIAWVGQR